MNARNSPPATLDFSNVPWLDERLFEIKTLAVYSCGTEITDLIEFMNGVSHCRDCYAKTADKLASIQSAAAALYLFATDALASIPEAPKRSKK